MVNAAAAFVCVIVVMVAGASVFAFSGHIPNAKATPQQPAGDSPALDAQALAEQSPRIVRNLMIIGFLLLSLVFFIRYQEEFL